ncbi:SGNH/GDSL hydrolase family protein [Desulfococcaceae bacterium HSG7]|nr:SGNH/GDSL hydrolase family protein [Desulfococcaceae bacterium HSG7]
MKYQFANCIRTIQDIPIYRLAILFTAFISCVIILASDIPINSVSISITNIPRPGCYQVYLLRDHIYEERYSQRKCFSLYPYPAELTFHFKNNFDNVRRMRFDLGDRPSHHVITHIALELQIFNRKIHLAYWPLKEFTSKARSLHSIAQIRLDADQLHVIASGEDPYFDHPFDISTIQRAIPLATLLGIKLALLTMLGILVFGIYYINFIWHRLIRLGHIIIRFIKLMWNRLFYFVYSLIIISLFFTAGEIFFRFNPTLSRSLVKVCWPDKGKRFYRHQYSRNRFYSDDQDGSFRIAIIGDSFAYGDGVEPYDSFAYRMDAWLNNDHANRPVTIELYPACGYSTYQEIPMLKDVLNNKKPDLVILSMCLNDTEDHTRSQELRNMTAKMTPVPPVGWMQALTDHSLFSMWLYRRWQITRTRPFFFQYYRKIYNPQYSGWRKFVNAAHQFKMLCDAAQTPLIVVIFPFFSNDLRVGQYPFTYCHDALNKIWNQEQVIVLDLYKTYMNMSPLRLQALPGMDSHPSEIAHSVAAKAIIAFLIEKQFLSSNYISPKMFQSFWHVRMLQKMQRQ